MTASSPRNRSRRGSRRHARPTVVCVFGTRPQLIKLSVVWRRLADACRLLLVDSGQHYDRAMAGTFYEREDLRRPDFNLNIRLPSAGAQVSAIAAALDPYFRRTQPQAVLTFGDTSTTAGAAIAAAYRNIPLAHIEAGLRSFNLSAAEEKNRLLTDHLSQWLFCPTKTAVENLTHEGIRRGVYGTGDVLYEIFRREQRSIDVDAIATRFQLPLRGFCFVTCHRAETVDHPRRLRALVRILTSLDRPALFTVHPRARKNLVRHDLWRRLQRRHNLVLTQPLDHQSTLAAIAGARVVLTDSGGVQREAFWSQTPCLTLRDRTEWPETVTAGGNRVVDLDADAVAVGLRRRWRIRQTDDPYFRRPHASRRIVELLLRDLAGR